MPLCILSTLFLKLFCSQEIRATELVVCGVFFFPVSGLFQCKVQQRFLHSRNYLQLLWCLFKPFMILYVAINSSGLYTWKWFLLDPRLTFVPLWLCWFTLFCPIVTLLKATEIPLVQWHQTAPWETTGVWKKKKKKPSLDAIWDMSLSLTASYNQEMTRFPVNICHHLVYPHIHAWAEIDKYFPLAALYGLLVEQSDAGCLVHSYFGFGSDPSVFVRVISGRAWPRGRWRAQCWISAHTVWPRWVYPKCLWTQG